ncbi:hypothetical protein DVH05_003581 [Phytophthora capsici]|nr:hypothetical protein DVH05_003581 [Phytophthora capsici]
MKNQQKNEKIRSFNEVLRSETWRLLLGQLQVQGHRGQGPKNNDFDEEEEVVEDDDGDDIDEEFGAVAEREHKLQQQASQQPQKQRRYWSGKPSRSEARSNPKFRPSSAPARRPKSASNVYHAQDNNSKQNRSAASISIAYLRAAAEKKKARDREFARDLFREENEFKKKISVKIDQANKMMAATGNLKSFAQAPVLYILRMSLSIVH